MAPALLSVPLILILTALTPGAAAGTPAPARSQVAGSPARPSAPASQATTASGRVLDTTGAPVAGARVELWREPDGDASAVATTDENGDFTVADLPAGRYRFIVTASRWVPVVRTIDVPRDDTAPLTLQFRALALSDEITVSVTHSARDTLRVPGEVSVVGREAFAKAQARSLDDVLRYEPGIEMSATRRLLQTPNIRGFSSSRVLVLRDGARVSQFTSGHKGSLFLDANDVERVEVVRGPASALYGSGALGGVLSISSPNPSDLLQPGQTLGGSLGVGYSSAYDEMMFNPRAYGASADGLGFAISYTGRRNDGLVDLGGDVGPLEAAEEDVDAFDARLVTPVGRSGSFRLSFNDFGEDGNSSINLESEVVGPEELVQRTTRQQVLTATYDVRTDTWWAEALRANAYWTGMELDETRPSDGRADSVELSTWGFDLRNSARMGAGQTVTYGVEMFQDRENSARDGEINHLFPPGRQTQLGLYVQDEIALLGGRVAVVPGLRWDRWNSSSDDAELEKRSDSELNPKVGATVEIVSGLVASVNYAEGFRAPNFQELYISGTHFRVPLGPGMTLLGLFTPNPDLDPETSRNVDVGLRFRRAGLQARAAWYHAWVDDFIDFNVTEGFIPPGTVLLTFTNENVQEAALQGFEGSVRWDVDARWSAFVNYSSPRGEDAISGEPLGSVPPAKTVVGLEFREPRLGALLGVDARFVADLDRVPEGVEPSDGYGLLDLYTAWTPAFLPEVTLRFNVDNVGDAEYEVPLFGTPGTGRDFRFGAVVNLGR